MFVDIVTIPVSAGDGGNGRVSFRHEKFVDKGGPDGGDGGKGGDVIFKATRNENTLAAFRYQKILQAEHGNPGDKRDKRGRSGKNLTILVPIGTSIINAENNQLIVDLTEDQQEFIVAKGGKGGFGNAHFTSSVRQAPRVAEKGEKGEQFSLTLEMKLVADVGLIGLPNAGKSTLLSVISSAKPEIANYPFTTTVPNLGVVDTSGTSLLVADIPGLIEGASNGKGLGDDFLRHVSRCKVLLHLIDSTSPDIATDYKMIVNELKVYSEELFAKPQLIVLTKSELVDEEIIAMQKELLQKVLTGKEEIYSVSAQTHANVKELMHVAAGYVLAANEAAKELAEGEVEYDGLEVITLQEDEKSWHAVKLENGDYLITGKKIETFAKRTDFENDFGVMRLRDILKKMGITKELLRLGIDNGDKILIGDPLCGELEY
jgi:GTP-binding protein